MAPSAQKVNTAAAAATRRNLVNPFGAILAAARGVLPDFSSLGYDSRLNFNETSPVEAADTNSYATTLVPGVETNGTIICIPGLNSTLGIPPGTLLVPPSPNADVDWWKIPLPSAGSLVHVCVAITFPTGFGDLVIDSSNLKRVSRTISGLETRDTYEATMHLRGIVGDVLKFRVAGLPSGNFFINLVTDNVYKLRVECLDVLSLFWPPRDRLELDLGNDSAFTASPLGSGDRPWAPVGAAGSDIYGINLSGLGFHDASDVDWFRLDGIPSVTGSCGSELEIAFSEDAVCSVLLGQNETNLLVLHRKQRSPITVPRNRTADAPIYLKLEPAYEAAAVEYDLSLQHLPSAADTCRATEAMVSQGTVLGSPLTRIGSIPFPEVLPGLGELPENFYPTMPARRLDSLGRITTPDWHLIRWKSNGDFAARLVLPSDQSLRARLLTLEGVELTRAETRDLSLSVTNEPPFSGGPQTLFLQKTQLPAGSYIVALSHARPETEVEVLLPRDAVEAGPGLEDIVASSYGYYLEVQRNAADGMITLKWPATGQLVELQEADVLPNWHRSSLTPTVVEGRTQVVFPATSGSRFFRLELRNP
jgi:hypothetical protein